MHFWCEVPGIVRNFVECDTSKLKECLSFVVDGVHERDGKKWGWIHGFQIFDKRTKKWQLREGIKKRDYDNWERGSFRYFPQLKRWKLVEGVKCKNGERIRGKWVFDKKEKKIKRQKIIKKCGYEKCKRSSENSKIIFKLCRECRKEFYCSKKHQKKQWECHKYDCSYY